MVHLGSTSAVPRAPRDQCVYRDREAHIREAGDGPVRAAANSSGSNCARRLRRSAEAHRYPKSRRALASHLLAEEGVQANWRAPERIESPWSDSFYRRSDGIANFPTLRPPNDVRIDCKAAKHSDVDRGTPPRPS